MTVHYDCKYRGIDVVSSRSARMLGGNRSVAEVRGSAGVWLLLLLAVGAAMGARRWGGGASTSALPPPPASNDSTAAGRRLP